MMIANNSARVLSFVLGCIAAFGAITASVGCGDNAPSSAKEITSFSFTAANNPTLHDDVAALITGDAITATVPFGTNVTALVATFRSTGVGVTAGGVVQTSGATANDFSAAMNHLPKKSVSTKRYGNPSGRIAAATSAKATQSTSDTPGHLLLITFASASHAGDATVLYSSFFWATRATSARKEAQWASESWRFFGYFLVHDV